MEHEPQGLTQSALARLIASDPNTIAALVERMEAWAGSRARGANRTAGPIGFGSCRPAADITAAREIALALQTEALAEWSEKKREEFSGKSGLGLGTLPRPG